MTNLYDYMLMSKMYDRHGTCVRTTGRLKINRWSVDVLLKKIA